MYPPTGLVLYDGPSLITGDRVVCLLSGLRNPSSNRKTGPMLQTYILAADLDPFQATKDGSDRAVCGDCTHRPGTGGACYVLTWQGPRQVWKSWSSDNYEAYRPQKHDRWLRGRDLRIGAYGDPAAVPAEVWESLVPMMRTTTGYTHQWRTAELQNVCMASVDSARERDEARALGYRTFRVRTEDSPLLSDEIMCPYSDEFEAANGRRVQCYQCGLCSGASDAYDVAIVAHGNKASSFTEPQIIPSESLTIL